MRQSVSLHPCPCSCAPMQLCTHAVVCLDNRYNHNKSRLTIVAESHCFSSNYCRYQSYRQPKQRENTLTEYLIGQRWYSINEPQLGLGIVVDTQTRRVQVEFPLCDETRVYAMESAQLSRLSLAAGEKASTDDGVSFIVDKINTKDGLMQIIGKTEQGDPILISEKNLDSHIQIALVEQQLMQGQFEHNKWFEFRLDLLQNLHTNMHSTIYGLVGARTSLLPHQLYIAHEVSSRYAPRVLLADEVGMGKTIEAGLILHRQMLLQRVQRVLIVVPPALLHQWLVEMLRKFNLNFSIFDQERFEAELENANVSNLFESEQLILCDIDFACGDTQVREQLLNAQWDMVIVDEAHHLFWSESEHSDEYALVEQLAQKCNSVLLLTGTPEQSGSQGHFARLRLLDPSRFHSLSQFEHEERQYLPLAKILKKLGNDESLSAVDIDLLRSMGISELLINDSGNKEQNSKDIIQQLIDRHGTGRVLFRNSRRNMEGFPKRRLHSHPLPCPEEYYQLWQTVRDQGGQASCTDFLSPEAFYQKYSEQNKQAWLNIDPRVSWLISFLAEIKPNKVLLITAQLNTALALTQYIRKNTGIRVTAFHEDMSIVERDRAAAYFAASEQDAQAMICSEIGSEGRNFQFAQHLVLFDLPLDPDLLEQRIGRLDRIGQAKEIHIHVPYLEHSFQNFYHDWYHQALNAFEKHCPSAHACYQAFAEDLHSIANSPPDDLETRDLLEAVSAYCKAKNQEFEQGRDQLLELNTFHLQSANELKSLCEDEDDSPALKSFLNRFFDYMGIESDIHSENSLVIRPGDHMRINQFPGLPEDGMIICFERQHALSHDDWQFITWEHPFVLSAIDFVFANHVASTTVCAVRANNIQPGQLLLQAVYVLDPKGNRQLQISKYLPSNTIKVTCDPQGKSLAYDHPIRVSNDININEEMVKQIVNGHRANIRELISACESIVASQLKQVKNEAIEKLSLEFQGEISRLMDLQKINPSIREDEIRFFREGLDEGVEMIELAGVRLDALRLMITT